MHSFLPLLLLVPSVLGRPQGLAVEELNKVAIHTAGPAITAASVSNAFDQVAADAVAVAAVTNAPVAAPTTAAKLARREDAILEKRGVNDPCGLQPVGYTYTTKPDTDSAFLSDTTYSSTANSAVTPYGYSQTFKNLQGSTSYGTFMELITINSYDPVQCAHLCDSNPDGCTSFNLYYERDPTVNPAPACLNPSSLTNVKCTLWKASTQSGAGATNTGQWRYDFHVVIAGSNGYFKDAAPPAYSGYEAPVEEGCAIDAPLAADGSNTFLGYKFFPSGDYSQCTAACSAQTTYDAANADSQGCYQPCNFVNAFVLSRNGVSAGIYCQLYSQPWDRSYATKCSQSTTNSDGPTTRYDVASSYGYKANPQDGVLSTCKANPTTYKTAASSTTSKAATSTSTTAASTTSADQDGQGQNQMGESSKTTKASATATSTTMATSTTSANQDDQGQNQMSGSSSKTAKASATTTSKSNNQQR